MTLTALILGAGPGVGHTVAAKLISADYAVAAASRNPDLTIAQTIGFHALKADLAQPDTIPALFSRAQEALGAAPNVVIYNGNRYTPPHEQLNLNDEQKFQHGLLRPCLIRRTSSLESPRPSSAPNIT